MHDSPELDPEGAFIWTSQGWQEVRGKDEDEDTGLGQDPPEDPPE